MERRKGSFRAKVKEVGFFNALIGTLQAKTDEQRIKFKLEEAQQDRFLLEGYINDRRWKLKRRELNAPPTSPKIA